MTTKTKQENQKKGFITRTVYVSSFSSYGNWESFRVSEEDFDLVRDEMDRHESTKWYTVARTNYD